MVKGHFAELVLHLTCAISLTISPMQVKFILNVKCESHYRCLSLPFERAKLI